MNLVRHDLGFSKTKKRFPMKGACLAIYSRTVNAELPLDDVWPSFVDAVQLVNGKSAGWPAELDLVCRWYAPHLERIHEDAAVRQRDLVRLAQIASGYSSRERFLTELTLDPPDSTSDQAGVPRLDEDYLILSTIHSAKGQEWQSVFLLNTIDGCLPSDLATGTVAEIEEERRLLYVAMTREGRSASDRSSALVRAFTAEQWRSARVCLAHAIYPR